MREPLTEAPKYKRWQQELKKNGLDVHGTEEIFTRHDHLGRALFSVVMLDAHTPEGDKIPPICFIKGDVATVMIVLIDEDTQEKYLLLVKQRRICNGDYIYEHVGGLVDGEDDPLDVAVREASEEAGMQLNPEQVHPLHTEPFFPSTGTSDEAMYMFYCELEMSKEKIKSYDAQQQGIISEHERIFTHVATIPESLQLIKNTNGLLSVYMYLALNRAGDTRVSTEN